jgi:hypothetical protein
MGRKRDESIDERSRGVETRDLARKRERSREGMRRLRAKRAAEAAQRRGDDVNEA